MIILIHNKFLYKSEILNYADNIQQPDKLNKHHMYKWCSEYSNVYWFKNKQH